MVDVREGRTMAFRHIMGRLIGSAGMFAWQVCSARGIADRQLCTLPALERAESWCQRTGQYNT